MRRTVKIYGNAYDVTVHKKSSNLWEAVGDYTEARDVLGNTRREVRVTGRNEVAALISWIKTAESLGEEG